MATVLANTRTMDRKTWLQWRQRGIGGSDIGAIAGLNPYRTALHVFLEKVQEIEGDEDEPHEAAEIGTLMEPVVAELAARRNPHWRIQRRNAMFQHPDYPWAIANIDRLVYDPQRGKGVMEIKTGSLYRLKEWDTDNAPDYQKVQLYWYEGILGVPWGVMAGILGGQHYRQFLVPFDQEIFGYLIQIAQDFWRHVETRTPPSLDGSAASTKLANALYRQSSPGKQITLPAEAAALIAQWNMAKADEEAAKARKDAAENRLKQLLADAEVGNYPGYQVTWKNVESKRWDTKALEAAHPELAETFKKLSVSRRFSIKPVKESE